MSGRRPIPGNLHLLDKGKVYGELRDRMENEPQPINSTEPKCPARLSKQEKREWRYFASILRNYGMLTPANGPWLDLLAVDMVQYKDCLEKVQKTGMLIKSPQGYPIYNPYWTAMNKLEDKITKILNEIGLSSVSLARIGGLMANAKRRNADPMEELLD